MSITRGSSHTGSVVMGIPRRLGKYILQDVLGQGSMGIVFKAQQEIIGRPVALKILSLKNAEFSNDGVQRFFNEAKTAARIIHPHIVPILDIGQDKGFYYFAMQFVEGRSLKEIIDFKVEGFTLYDKIEIFEGMVKALVAAHEEGIIHRDIKPGNIHIDPDGAPKLLDFGIAKLEEAPGLTRTGIVVGSPPFMSPEQARGEKLDFRTDVFSLGVVIYEFLTGERAFQSENKRQAIMDRQRMEKLPKSKQPKPMREVNPQIPPMLELIIQKCMQPLKEYRYSRTLDLLKDLQGLKETFLKEETDLVIDGKFARVLTYKGRKIKLNHIKGPVLTGAALAGMGLLIALLRWIF